MGIEVCQVFVSVDVDTVPRLRPISPIVISPVVSVRATHGHYWE